MRGTGKKRNGTIVFKKKVGSLTVSEKRELVDMQCGMPIMEQCALLQLNRSSLYYRHRVNPADIVIMNAIDEIHTDFPWYGKRPMSRALQNKGFVIGKAHTATLMRRMGIEALYPHPDTSKPCPEHSIYPYLLKGISAAYPNHIWATDITYIRLKNTWMYLCAVIDWFSRYIVAWQLMDTMEVILAQETLRSALASGVSPAYFNMDQGSVFTSDQYLNILRAIEEIKISMDHRGRCFDNIFTERFWRSLKYEEVYVKDYTSPRESRQSIGDYMEKYNTRRLHAALNYKTPAEVYFG